MGCRKTLSLRGLQRDGPLPFGGEGNGRMAGDLLYEPPRIGDDTMVSRPVPANLDRFRINLDDGGISCDLLPKTSPEVPIHP